MTDAIIGDMISISFGKAPGIKNWLKRRRAPKTDKLMIYTVYYTCQQNISLKQFMDTVVYAQKKFEERNPGVNLGIPWYWYKNGPVVSWPDLKEKMEKNGYFMSVKSGHGRELSIESFQEYVAEEVG